MKCLALDFRLIAFATVLSLNASSVTGEESNVMCPVLQDQQATSDYVLEYKGKEIRFCCSECVKEFQKNPEIYEYVLPQLQNLPWRAQLQLFMADHGGLALGSILFAVLIALRVYRWRNLKPADTAQTGLRGLLQKKITPTVPLLALAGYLGFEVYTLQDQLHQTQLEDEIHFATFYDFGYPPVPKRPDVEPAVTGSFYRGNDERSPKLFNNGNYRTATFHVSLCDASGQPVEVGDSVEGKELHVKFEIDRPPFTPDFLYDKAMMETMFLTKECDRFLGRYEPVPDEVGLTETEAMQHWEAIYPVRRADAGCCSNDCRGTIYVCEKYFYQPKVPLLDKRRGGSRFHYGIRYNLNIKHNILASGSDVYMGALYRTRKLPTWRVPMTQWFSHEPIPVLPGENVDDPELLGINDHLAKRSGTSEPR